MPKYIFYLIFLIINTKGIFGQNIISFTTSDGIKIAASYAVPNGNKLPAIIFIHQGGSNKEEWTSSPLYHKLYESGYAVLAYDIRNHGKSDKDEGSFIDLFSNPNRAPLDLKSAIEFLQNDSHINKKRIAVIGSSIGGNLACMAMNSKDYAIKTAVAISCKTAAVKGLSATDKLQMKSIFFISSANDQKGKRAEWAEELLNLTTSPKQLKIGKGNAHGIGVLNDNPELINDIFNWIKQYL